LTPLWMFGLVIQSGVKPPQSKENPPAIGRAEMGMCPPEGCKQPAQSG